MHGAHPGSGGFAPVQQVQKMRADGIIIGLHVDALAAVREVMPVAQYRSQTRQQAIGQIARLGGCVRRRFRVQTPEYRHAAAQHIHGMAAFRQLLQHGVHRGRQRPQPLELRPVSGKFAAVG